jgi:undecaprenyl-diphosphatase
VLLVLGLGMAVLAGSHDRLPGDDGIARWVQDLPVPGQDFADLVRTVTETEVVLATGLAIALVLWLRGYRRQAVLLAAGLVVMGLVSVGLKEIVDRPRPSPDLVERRAEYDSSSFPSGHVLSATVLYGVLLYYGLTLRLPPAPRVALITVSALLLVLVGPVSVWLGVHWPSDVAGSWLWALAVLVPVILLDRLESGPG